VTPAQIDVVTHTFDGNFDNQRRVSAMRNWPEARRTCFSLQRLEPEPRIGGIGAAMGTC
jgi:hypothetical protein